MDYRFSGFPDGINNIGRDDQIPSSALRKAQNVDLLVSGDTVKLRRRKGYAKLVSGTNMHSVYGTGACLLAVDNGSLKRWVELDGATLTIATDVREPVAYVDINGETVWSDGSQWGVVNAMGQPSAFGVPAPTGQPTLAALDDGGLYAGSYQVAVTYSRDGQESGAQGASLVRVEEGGGIRLSNIPQSVDADAINIYMSQADGETLYFRTSVPQGTTIYELGYLRQRRALRTMFHDRLPASNQLAFYNGVLYAAADTAVMFSNPMNYSLHHTTENFLQLDSPVRLLRAGEQGIFVGTDTGVYFFRGTKPADFSQQRVSGPAIEGASLEVDGGFMAPQLQGQTVVVWWTESGVMMVGLPDGKVEPVRDTEFRSPSAQRGMIAPVVREGAKQLVSVMKNPGTKSSLAFGDEMEIEVHRHGVET